VLSAGTSSATGKRSNSVAAAMVSASPFNWGSMVAPVNTSRKSRGRPSGSVKLAGSSIRVSPQTTDPSGGVMASEINDPIKRGTHVMVTARRGVALAPTRPNANRQSRRPPAICSGT
jgi:hypothetical protein